KTDMILNKYAEGGELPGAEEPIKKGRNTYAERVSANMQFMGTGLHQWKAVPIKGFASTENDKGKDIEVPEFDFPKGYKKAKSLYACNTGGEINCELCGKEPIKV